LGWHIWHNVVNLTNTGTWRAPIDELIPIGPLQVSLKLPQGIAGRGAKLLFSAASTPVTVSRGWAEFPVKSIVDHEVVVLS
jgi:hypothetical protein